MERIASMKTTTFTFTVLLLVASSQNLHASDQCRDILTKGVFNYYDDSKSSKAASALASQACSSNVGTVLRQRANALCKSSASQVRLNARLKGSYGLYSGDASFSKLKSFQKSYCSKNRTFNMSKWQKKRCSRINNNRAYVRARNLLMKTASKNIVDAWKSCMLQNKEKIICWVKPINDSELYFTVKWRFKRNRGSIKELKVALSKDLKHRGKKFGKSIKVRKPKGEQPFFLQRRGRKKALVSAQLIFDSGFSEPCHSIIPSIKNTPKIRPFIAPQPSPRPVIRNGGVKYDVWPYNSLKQRNDKTRKSIHSSQWVGVYNHYPITRVRMQLIGLPACRIVYSLHVKGGKWTDEKHGYGPNWLAPNKPADGLRVYLKNCPSLAVKYKVCRKAPTPICSPWFTGPTPAQIGGQIAQVMVKIVRVP